MAEKDLEKGNLEEEVKETETPEIAEAAEESAEEAAAEETAEEAEDGKEGKKEKKGFFSKKKDPRDTQIEELTDRLKRNMAEFDNFRKRTEKEKSAMYEIGAKDVISKILPVVDNFERGLAAIPEEMKGTPVEDGMEKIYDFELMQKGGHIRGYKLSAAQIDAVAEALEGLTSDAAMQSKYGVSGVAPLLFAVGDGNHSLATAKACYEEQKAGKTPEEYLKLPARYALVEVVNNHDDALQFEPIHRVVFDIDKDRFMEMFMAAYPNAYEGKGEGHVIEFVWEGVDTFYTVPDPKVQLAVGTLQAVIDDYVKNVGGEVDYIHGDDVTRELGSKSGNMGFLLPAMGKEQLFKTVMADGVLPRKTFSMGHAQDKRYYIEARAIR